MDPPNLCFLLLVRVPGQRAGPMLETGDPDNNSASVRGRPGGLDVQETGTLVGNGTKAWVRGRRSTSGGQRPTTVRSFSI